MGNVALHFSEVLLFLWPSWREAWLRLHSTTSASRLLRVGKGDPHGQHCKTSDGLQDDKSLLRGFVIMLVPAILVCLVREPELL